MLRPTIITTNYKYSFSGRSLINFGLFFLRETELSPTISASNYKYSFSGKSLINSGLFFFLFFFGRN